MGDWMLFQELRDVGVESDFDVFIDFFNHTIYNSPCYSTNVFQGVITIALVFSAVSKQNIWKNIIESLKIGRKYHDLKRKKIYRLVVEHLYIPYFLEKISEQQLKSFDDFRKFFSRNSYINGIIKQYISDNLNDVSEEMVL